jgi:hypothetical protein
MKRDPQLVEPVHEWRGVLTKRMKGFEPSTFAMARREKLALESCLRFAGEQLTSPATR